MMRAKITGTEKRISRYGGDFYYLFFRGDDGKSYRTCIDPKCRNFKRWKAVLKKFNKGLRVILDNLFLYDKNMINADSEFIECDDFDELDEEVKQKIEGAKNIQGKLF